MDRVSAVRSVFEALKAEIQSGYKPGDHLPNERHFAERFSVSRNTVREALIFLEAYGLVEKTQRGPRVTTPDVSIAFRAMEHMFDRSLETCRDIIEFRRFIEMGILPAVVKHITDAEIDGLVEQVERMEKALTVHEAAEADYMFHLIMIEASRNKIVRKLYHVLAQIIIFYMEIGKAVPRHDMNTLVGHRAIADALRRRSLPDLLKAATDHYDYSEGVLDETIAQHRPKETTAT
jgi:DNA-binding FadR family transcriptional regulator